MFGRTKIDKLRQTKKNLFKIIKAKHCYSCRHLRGSEDCFKLCGGLVMDYRKVDAELYEKSVD